MEAGATHEAVHTDTDPETKARHELAHKEAEDVPPSALIPTLKVLMEASAAFTPLQSAADVLLNVVQVVEVRCRFSL